MKKIYFLPLFILLLFSTTSVYGDEVKGDGLYAITFHADWCGSCKALEPLMSKARGKADLDNENVLFITLDLTDATTRNCMPRHWV